MKILVPTKRVPDPDQRVRATACGTGLDDSDLYYVPNPFDLIAVEEALVIKERETEEVEIVTVGVGVADYEKELRTTLAMGADRALLVEAQADLDPWNVASALMKVIEREQPDFVLMGKQAVDDDSNQVGQFLEVEHHQLAIVADHGDMIVPFGDRARDDQLRTVLEIDHLAPLARFG